jgi:hypothetical protein
VCDSWSVRSSHRVDSCRQHQSTLPVDDVPTATLTPAQALEEWFRLADEVMKDAPPGPTAREILEQDRNRLERR